jgi:hypothetical protein
MLSTRRIFLALGAICFSVIAFVPAALASGLASVTVRVEGASSTLVPPTEVTTGSSPIVKDGNVAHSCPGTSAAGALQGATAGNWSGVWFTGLGYTVETIAGESHQFEPGAAANYFWSLWLDNKPATTGVCGVELNPGDSILLFPECFSETVPSPCPPPPNPLGIAAPGVAEAGAPVTVTVTSYANATGAPSPAGKVMVAGGGASAETDPSGRATLKFSASGSVVVHASAPGSVRAETTICVHHGNDGTCGTQVPSGPASASTPAGSGVAGVRYTGSNGILAKAGGVIDGHVYGPGAAPRLLQGTITGSVALKDVKLRLTRTLRRGGGKASCSYYDGLSERFRSMRCGAVHGRYFLVGARASVSYLLPAALAPGRYVLDVEATDAAGDQTRLARGTSRIVFYVG